MCSRVRCRTCGKTTWAGCGMHVGQVMKGVPASERCECPRAASAAGGGDALQRLAGRLFGGRGTR